MQPQAESFLSPMFLPWRWSDLSTGGCDDDERDDNADDYAACLFIQSSLPKTPRVMAGTICQYYYTVGYLTMAGLAFLLNDSSWQVIVIGHDL